MKSVSINRIEWMSQEESMTLWVNEKVGDFNLESRMIVSIDLLNELLCDIQQNLEEGDINDLMRVEQWSPNEFSYVFDFSDLPEQIIFRSHLYRAQEARRIRA